jgi:hypothetical protein
VDMYISFHICPRNKHRDNFTFPLLLDTNKLSCMLLLLLEALQLQRSFGLLNEFLSFASIAVAVLPVVYSLAYYIIFTSSFHLFWVSLVALLTWVSIHILF